MFRVEKCLFCCSLEDFGLAIGWINLVAAIIVCIFLSFTAIAGLPDREFIFVCTLFRFRESFFFRHWRFRILRCYLGNFHICCLHWSWVHRWHKQGDLERSCWEFDRDFNFLFLHHYSAIINGWLSSGFSALSDLLRVCLEHLVLLQCWLYLCLIQRLESSLEFSFLPLFGWSLMSTFLFASIHFITRSKKSIFLHFYKHQLFLRRTKTNPWLVQGYSEC